MATYNRSIDIATRQGIRTTYDSRKFMVMRVGWLAAYDEGFTSLVCVCDGCCWCDGWCDTL